MYTPMKFCNQVEHQIIIPGYRNMEDLVNHRSIAYVKSKLSRDRDSAIGLWMRGYVCSNPSMEIPDRELSLRLARNDSSKYSSSVGVAVPDIEDFCHSALLTTVMTEWEQTKKVYLLEETMGNTLLNMKVPDTFLMEPILHLPAKCLYIDYRECHIFGDNVAGTLVLTSRYNGYLLLHFLHLVDDGGRVGYIVQDLAFRIEGDELTLGLPKGVSKRIELDQGSVVLWDDERFASFFTNFCLYLSASNNDVEYTERTKSIYKPRKAGAAPKAQLREVEEFGIGFRYAQSISASTPVKRSKPNSIPNNETSIKRAYSSCYRSAHWHHYWINDPESDTGKSLIVKWVNGTFVQGNKPNNSVTVHVVKE